MSKLKQRPLRTLRSKADSPPSLTSRSRDKYFAVVRARGADSLTVDQLGRRKSTPALQVGEPRTDSHRKLRKPGAAVTR